LVAAKGITGDLPHFSYGHGDRRAFHGNRFETCALRAQAGERGQTVGSAFLRLNDHFSREHLIVLRQQSRFAELAVMYSCLTRKRVVYLDSWSDSVPSNLETAKSVLLVYAPDEKPHVMRSAILRSDRYCLGVASGQDEAAASWFLLRNYFDFLGPRALRERPSDNAKSLETHEMFEGLFFSGENDCFDAIELFVSLLKAGYTTGDAIRFASLCAKQTLLIAGDPAVRFFPCRPETRKMDELNMTVLKFPRDKFSPGVTHWFGPADSVRGSRRGAGSGRRGTVWARASFIDASTRHLFEFRRSADPNSQTWQPFRLLAS
jgi:hypothetical protein